MALAQKFNENVNVHGQDTSMFIQPQKGPRKNVFVNLKSKQILSLISLDECWRNLVMACCPNQSLFDTIWYPCAKYILEREWKLLN